MRLFVSYKSEDCNVVRQVVETLMAAGVSVWFAEYQVLPSDYDDFDRNIAERLRDAVGCCDHALVFSNNKWANSEYCRIEMQAVVALIPPDNIIEIQIPHEELPHRSYPALEVGATLDYASDPEATAGAVLELLGLAGNPRKRRAPLTAGARLNLARFGLTLNPGPFEASIVRSREFTEGHRAPTIALKAELDGHVVRLAVVLNVFDSVLQSLQIAQDGSASDREVYRAYREYAQKWENDASLRIRGLHLAFWQGHSQLALTYTAYASRSGSEGAFWERRYVLSSRGATPSERGEVHLLFFTPYLTGSPEEQARQFAALCPLFDQIMETVRYDPVGAHGNVSNVVPTGVVRVAYLALCCWGLFGLSVRGGKADWIILLAMVAGAVTGESFVLLYSRVYRHILWSIGTTPVEDAPEDAYSRVTTNLPYELVCYPTVLGGAYLYDLLLVLSSERGTLWFPGPGLAWFLAVWLVLVSRGYTSLGLQWSAILGAVAGMLVTAMVILRFVCLKLHKHNWRDLELN